MKHLVTTAALLFCLAGAHAQLVRVGELRQVALPEGVSAMQAEISPDGAFVVASSCFDGALRTISLSDGSVTRLADCGEIYQLQFTPDSRRVVYRRSTTDESHRRFTSVRCADLTAGTDTEIIAPQRRMHGLSVDGTNVRILQPDGLVKKSVAKNASTVAERPMASVRFGELVVTRGNNSVAINPQGREGMSYLWPTVSPDGTKVAYVLAGYGCYVCDIDGANPVRLGDFRAPRWLGNNLVVGMYDRDNGYVFTESTIIAADLSGTIQTLTPPDVIALNPSVDASGQHIAFTTPEGHLYILSLNR